MDLYDSIVDLRDRKLVLMRWVSLSKCDYVIHLNKLLSYSEATVSQA